MPRFYLDVPRALASLDRGQTPYTANVNMVLALQVALRLIQEEGLHAFRSRHERMARACRAAALAAGLELLVTDVRHASEVVTAIRSPAGLDSTALVKAVREKHGVVISGGQDQLKGKIFRIGHLGAAQLGDLLRTWRAVATELHTFGLRCDIGECSAAAEEAYAATETP
jgi:aspartate aminotransferase-like enzyme